MEEAGVFLLAQELPRAFGYDVSLAVDWSWIVGLLVLPVIGGITDLVRMSSKNAPTLQPSSST